MKKKGAKPMFRKGQVVFNIKHKSFGVIDLITDADKGKLYTVKYIDNKKDDTKPYGRYYADRMVTEFVAMKNTDMAYILYANGKEK